ncbi:MAG: TonB-dependent receptor [Pseudomonadota bacterium]
MVYHTPFIGQALCARTGSGLRVSLKPAACPWPLLSALALCHAPLWAQPAEATLPAVVISVTRNAQSSFDLPASIDVVDQSEIGAARLLVNVSESLVRVPGIVAQNRQNYAQDVQISSRGFGARASFGVRGLRLYADGIPATQPDGQGQVSHFDLASASRMEVLRGPFSALYGNSSGGVISLFTEDGGPHTLVESSAFFGSDNTLRLGTKLSGQEGKASYVLSASRFTTDGYRDHSAAKRTSFNGKLKYAVSPDTRWTLVLNSVDMPDVQDPLGLSRAEYEVRPRQATPNATIFNTRKSVAQTQFGTTLEHRLSAEQSVQFTAYAGKRSNTQFQAIPIATQTPATHPGGVIDLSRDYGGVDARWTLRGQLLGRPATSTFGVAYEALKEQRRGFQNFVGNTTGVQGALRRDENNTVRSFDQYAQGEWVFAERWTALAGVRHSSVSFRSTDQFLSNGNDSGSTRYTSTNPVAGLTFHATDSTNLYVTAGRGFETPTFNELAYRPTGGGGLNLGLAAATSQQLELGIKSRMAGWQLNAALFRARTENEIVVQTNSGGRTTFQNAGDTERRGFELSASGDFSRNFGVYLAATRLDATYADGFLTCTAAPCATPNVLIPAGNRIPGIPRTTLYAELLWRQPAWGMESALELRRVSRVLVDDRNSDGAPGYATANLRISFKQQAGPWTFKEFARIDNLSGRQYAGSVIVNEGNARFFESAPLRTWLLGVHAIYRF